MPAGLQSGLPTEVKVVSTLKRPAEHLESDTEILSETHVNGRDPQTKARPSVVSGPLLALSLIKQVLRLTISCASSYVNPPTSQRSLLIPFPPKTYASDLKEKEGVPYVLDLSFDAEWRCWGADKCAFSSVEAFRAFCVGGVDPDQGRSWDPFTSWDFMAGKFKHHIWMSSAKDIVFETSQNPLDNGGCHYFGVADKAIVMYNFMHDNQRDFKDSEGDPAMTTVVLFRFLVIIKLALIGNLWKLASK